MTKLEFPGKLYYLTCEVCGEELEVRESCCFLNYIAPGLYYVPEPWYDLDTSGLMCGCDEEYDQGLNWKIEELELHTKGEENLRRKEDV